MSKIEYDSCLVKKLGHNAKRKNNLVDTLEAAYFTDHMTSLSIIYAYLVKQRH